MAENQTREYKLQLPGPADAEKKDFLADISAMANTAGGVVVYGVETGKDASGRDNGIPVNVPGVVVENFDAERQRLEAMLRDGLSPPITAQATVVEVKLASGTIAVAVGVGRSALGPHRVTFKGSTRFYRRNQSGNYQPEVPELRRMFLEQTEWIEEALAFRDRRIADVVGGSAFPNLASGTQTFVHVLPLGRRGEVIDYRGRSGKLMEAFPPLEHFGYSPRYNADGFLAFSQQTDGRWCSYTQLFRTGAVEGVSTLFASEPEGERGTRRLWAEKLGRELNSYVPMVLRSLRTLLGVEPPYALCISLNSIKGAVIPDSRGTGQFGTPIDRDRLCMEPLLVEDPESFSADQLLPLLDVVWQSAGWEGVPR